MLDKLIHKAINGENFHGLEVTVLAVAMFAAGFFLSIPTPATGYQTSCEDLYKTVTFNYTGSIDDYQYIDAPTDIFASTNSGRGGVLLASSNQLAVENGTRLNFSFTEEVTVTCSNDDIQVNSYFFNETLQNNSEGDMY